MNRTEIAILWSQTRQHASRVARSKAIISDALALGVTGYIALSGGKDSTVVLNLVRSLAPDTPAVYSDDEWILPETDAYISRVDNVIRIAGEIEHAEWFTSWQRKPGQLKHPELPIDTIWVEAPHNDGLQTYAKQMGYKMAYMGLRMEESSERNITLKRWGPLHFAAADGFWHCNPIATWSWKDVWAYIVANNLDYNHAYDRLEEIGVPPERQRIGPLANAKVLGYGQIAILKRGWPDIYNSFVARYPQAASYT